MRDEDKTKEQLISELVDLRRQVAELEVSETEREQVEKAPTQHAQGMTRSNAFMAALSQVAARIGATLDPDRVMESLGAELQKLGMNCLVATLASDGTDLVVQYVSLDSSTLKLGEKLSGVMLDGYHIPRERWLPHASELFEQGRPMFVSDPVELTKGLLPRLPEAVVERVVRLAGVTSDTSVIYLPLTVEDEVLGTLGVWGPELREQDITALSVFVSQVAIVLENTRLYTAERREKAYFEQLFESAPEAIVVVDNDSRVLRVNSEFTRMFGYTPEEVLGRLIDDLLAPDDLREEAVSITKQIAGGKRIATETVRQHKDGTLIDVSILGTPIRVDGGQIAVYGIYRDITERKQVEEALRESEARYRSVVESSHAGVIVANSAYQLTYVNDELCRIMGYPCEELIGEDFRKFLDEESREIVANRLVRRQKGEKVPSRYEFDIIRKDGKKRHVEVSATVIKDSAGNVRTIGQILDITERKQAEKALRESEARYRSLFEHSPIALCEEDLSEVKKYIDALRAEGISDVGAYLENHPEAVVHCAELVEVLDVNQAALDLYEADSKETFRDIMAVIVPEETPAIFREELIDFIQGKTYFEAEAPQFTLTGDRLHVYGSTIMLPSHEETWSKVLISMVDITDRKRVEKALRESEAHYRTLFDSASDAIFIHDLEGHFLEVNRAACERLGYSREELLQMGPTDIDSQEYAPLVPERIEKLRQQGHDFFETVHVRKDGTTIPVELSSRVIEYAGGPAVLSIARDITERKRAEEALEERNRELALLNRVGKKLTATLNLDKVLVDAMEEVRRLLDVTACSVWLLDPETEELVCRQAIGPQSDLVCGWRLAPGEGLAGWVAQRGESMVVPDTRVNGRHFKGVDQQVGEEMRSILSVPLRVKDSVIGVLQVLDTQANRFGKVDLTLLQSLTASAAIAIDNARLVETLRQRTAELQARNEELDAFAHTVAHDLKNPLSLVIGFAEALEKDLASLSNEDLRQYLQTIARKGRKMSNIVDELLLLSLVRRLEEVEVRPLDMASIIDEVQRRLASLIEKHQAEIILPGAWPVAMGYGAWIEEVWVNYLNNAIKYGGQPPRVELGADPQPDGMVRFWVRDNGPGLTQEEQDRLFIPLTQLGRTHAEGYGLGLSIARRIAERLGGQVSVESEPGQGSVFAFSLPGVIGTENQPDE